MLSGSTYIEIAKGDPSHRGIIIAMSDLSKMIKIAQDNKEQLFRSVFSFDEEIKEHFKTNKTVRNYTGKYYADSLIFDIDKGVSTDAYTLERAQKFVTKLINEWNLKPEQISIWFSGTGYHITTGDFFEFEPSSTLPLDYRATLTNYFPEADDKIYIKTGLIRVGNTINTKKGLYKIPIDYDKFINACVGDIVQEAWKPRRSKKRENNLPSYSTLIIKGIQPREVKIQTSKEEPTRIITCAQKIYNEGALEGKRHENLLAWVSVFRRQGIPYDGIEILAKSWNEKNGQSLDDKELNDKIKYFWDKGYTPSCHHATLAKYCDPRCIHFKNKDMSIEIFSNKNLTKLFKEFAKTGIHETTLDLNEVFNLGKPHKIYPREFIYFQGDTGIGKSTLVMNIVLSISRFKILYITNEVGEELFFRRMIQIGNMLTKEEVIEHYSSPDHIIEERNYEEVCTHIDTMFQGTTLEDLKKKIAENNYQIVVIDVLDKMKVSKNDYTAKTEELALELKNLAKAMNIIIIGVHHISKEASKSGQLNVHSGKGGSGLEQNADQVFSIEGDPKSSTRYLSANKARDEGKFNIMLFFDESTYKMVQQLP